MIWRLCNNSRLKVTNEIPGIFSGYSVSEYIVRDNGPQFQGKFERFTKGQIYTFNYTEHICTPTVMEKQRMPWNNIQEYSRKVKHLWYKNNVTLKFNNPKTYPNPKSFINYFLGGI